MRGWIRLGLVLSVIWVLVAFFYVRNSDMKSAQNFSSLAYSTCSNAKAAAKNFDLKECSEKASKAYQSMDPGPSNALVGALLPLPLMWLAVWLAVAVVRWVIRGFKAA
ncbi:hypothetical protein [Bradyrhizobium archetypum]|uniref:Uncharacterized protein n=1 Tax=Bradyrhizobium archetypum TaxID=2721160 RepID=A0A7Y4H2E9_9BRAD|nr:hypothetical protein [Bradyrhizobium archetypum]NOJ46054.1 hypothetical protein [Bradyrhizobium archetypum]